MGKLLLIGFVMMSAISEASKQKSLEASLIYFKFQENTGLASADINYGSVFVDRANEQITLRLGPSFRCPEGAMCAQVMPQQIVMNFTLNETTTGTCGEVIYKGDNGAIEVVDNTNNVCKTYVALNPTEVRLVVERPVLNNVREEHMMYGEKLFQTERAELAIR